MRRIEATLPNGKEVLILEGLVRPVGWQRYPGEPWQPFDPAILKFTPADKLVEKEV